VGFCGVAHVAYLLNPAPTDTTCIKAIGLAREDIIKGKIVLNDHVFGENIWEYKRNRRRYFNELKELATRYGMDFCPIIEYCIVFEGQTDNCYEDIMSLYIAYKYGRNFTKTIHEQADSLFLEKTKKHPVNSWYCDNSPYPKGIEPEWSGTIDINTTIPITISRKEWYAGGESNFAVYNPMMDIQILINSDGKLSHFEMVNFVPMHANNSNP
jgi:hypothetical protein